MERAADLHIHTGLYSLCSINTPGDILRKAEDRGLHTIGVVDHNGPFGALEVRAIARRTGSKVRVLIGQEVPTRDYGDLLVYGVEEMIRPASFQEVVGVAREKNGATVWAHPFSNRSMGNQAREALLKMREGGYLPDGLETRNGQMLSPVANRHARQVAEEFQLAQTGGSDSHFIPTIGMTRTVFNDDLDDDVISAIRNKRTRVEGGPGIRGRVSRLLAGGVKFYRKSCGEEIVIPET